MFELHQLQQTYPQLVILSYIAEQRDKRHLILQCLRPIGPFVGECLRGLDSASAQQYLAAPACRSYGSYPAATSLVRRMM